ncbi:hypothetical protein ACFV8W_40155, partial [Streptomyces sp. NPDC059786]
MKHRTHQDGHHVRQQDGHGTHQDGHHMCQDGRHTRQDGYRTRQGGTVPGHRRMVTAAAAGGCALAVALGTAPPAAAGDAGPGRGVRYAALGDSYTSGPLIPQQVDANCARSDHNYPSIVAAERRVSAFKDVSCGGATTEQMWKSQGTNGPQL